MEFKCLYEGKDNVLVGHRKTETKKNLEDIITMDYDVFVNSQMFGQNDAGKYLNGTDKTKKEMLISLLMLDDIVSGCLDKVREKKNAQTKKIDLTVAAIDLLEKEFTNKQTELRGEECDGFEAEVVKNVIEALEELKKGLEKRLKDISNEIVEADKKIEALSLYKTQFELRNGWFDLENFSAQLRVDGVQTNTEFAEAFVQYKGTWIVGT